MQAFVLEDIPVKLPLADLARRLHVREDSPQREELAQLVAAAESVARPKAMGGIAFIDDRGDNYVVLDGIRFESRILAVNLARTQRVFPFVATCGTEIDAWALGIEDFLHRYWTEAIREAALRVGLAAMMDWIDTTYQPGKTARMNPGSLADWPIEQQAPLFTLLGEAETRIGVQLTESLLMIPSKSVSGIRFGTSDSFESCLLCPRIDCPGRRAPFDPSLAKTRYNLEPALATDELE